MSTSSRFIRVLQVLLLSVFLVIVGYRILIQDVGLEVLTPEPSYKVTLRMDMTPAEASAGAPMRVSTYVPASNERQRVAPLPHQTGPLSFEVTSDATGRRAVWRAEAAGDAQEVSYAFRVWPQSVAYQLDDELKRPAPGAAPPALHGYLRETPAHPVGTAAAQARYERIAPRRTDRLVPLLQALFEHAASVSEGTGTAAASERTGAPDREGNRWLVTLARQAHIPSRLVGGLMLHDGQASRVHQWAELHINGHWVPFDAAHGHFATLPASYLPLCRGATSLAQSSAGTGLKYTVDVDQSWTARQEMERATTAASTATPGLWKPLTDAGLSLDLLMLMLLLPVGGSMVVFFRNVVGLETYGTFLPALLAVACLATGLLWGMLAFLIVTLTVAVLHLPLERAGLMHTPRLAILMVCVIVQILLTALSVQFEWVDLSYFILFPVVILTSTAERFSAHLTEDGPAKAAKVTLMTAFVIACSYFIMNFSVVGLTLLAFPEVLLLVISFNVWLGRWVGIRLTEYTRFRWLINRHQDPSYATETR
ncbi:MAG: hypothetical protein GVY15_03665 [Bacteroidetes bacterium]|jgi:transglutaminase-like putative cysteine protease|nr:hypothetical protein [Bacteroidota bacterium]